MPCSDCAGDYERVEMVWPGKGKPVEHVSYPFQTIEIFNGKQHGVQRPKPNSQTYLIPPVADTPTPTPSKQTYGHWDYTLKFFK